MAGAGKTTLIQQMNSYMSKHKKAGYLLNLDPAVMNLPYEPNIDIRDTVNYKQVMKEYKLGPNGGILTACNMYATKFDQVMTLLEKPREPPLETVVVDTPGQIEIFTWSASGNIVTELLASSFPTLVVYVIDTKRCTAPQTFMSNMMQACSILYKTRLPMVLAFNKVDVVRHEFALEWMNDRSAFWQALSADDSYASGLSQSLSLVLDEFYSNLSAVGVSGITGEGMDELFRAIDRGAVEYHEFYEPELQRRRDDLKRQEAARQEADMQRISKDLSGTRESDED